MNVVKRIHIKSDFDVVVARMQTREVAKQMGFGTADQARISLATSELARIVSWKSNHYNEIILSDACKNGYTGMQVVCLVDLEQIKNGEKSSPVTKDSLVLPGGLAGARRLVDESKVEMLDDKQARVTLMKWLIKKN